MNDKLIDCSYGDDEDFAPFMSDADDLATRAPYGSFGRESHGMPEESRLLFVRNSDELLAQAFSCRGVKSHEVNHQSDKWFQNVVHCTLVSSVHSEWDSVEWLSHRLLSAEKMLPLCVEVNPRRRRGIPVIIGTRVTAAEVLAEIGDGKRSVDEICEALDLDAEHVKTLISALAIYLDRPFPITAYANTLSTGRKLERF